MGRRSSLLGGSGIAIAAWREQREACKTEGARDFSRDGRHWLNAREGEHCMHFHKHRRPPATLLEQSELALNAAAVMRDISLLHAAGGMVRHGCRSVMRQHALQWRNPSLLSSPHTGL